MHNAEMLLNDEKWLWLTWFSVYKSTMSYINMGV